MIGSRKFGYKSLVFIVSLATDLIVTFVPGCFLAFSSTVDGLVTTLAHESGLVLAVFCRTPLDSSPRGYLTCIGRCSPKTKYQTIFNSIPTFYHELGVLALDSQVVLIEARHYLVQIWNRVWSREQTTQCLLLIGPIVVDRYFDELFGDV